MGFGLVIFPFSWRLGPWSRAKKWMFAIGPLRIIWHRQPGQWK